MASIVYKPLSSFAPVELKYSYYKNEALNGQIRTYREGFTFYELDGFINYRDTAINRDTCLVLTSAVTLSSVFIKPQTLTIGDIPATIQLLPRYFGPYEPVENTLYYLKYNPSTNTIKLTLTAGSTFFIQPIINTNEIELFADGLYVQVSEEYPYEVYLSNRALDPESIHRQRFQAEYGNGLITFKTKTKEGYRYLACNNDGVLRGVGLLLSESVVNDYVFKCEALTSPEIAYGFIPTNNWVTYYYDIESGIYNNTLDVNKNFDNTTTNFLATFSMEEAITKGKAVINLANLKTSLTPTGGPAPIDNSYSKEPLLIL